MYACFIKRLLDIVISGVGILVLMPVYIIIAIMVAINMGTPVLYGQMRIGKDEKPFKLYKFRSMTDGKDAEGNLLPETERITSFGATLRSSSLDELPELFSILLGDMSIVGPRPMPTYYGPYFLPEERKRHTVRGGLIPPDSLSGKTYTTYEEQFAYEVDYAQNITFMTDVKVILMTFKILAGRVETNYGSDFDRPHLNVYRKDMIK